MNRCCHSPRVRHGQRGVVLISAVVFLLVLSLLGVWSVSNAVLQERMAGSTRHRGLAFEGAEAAIKHAEATIVQWRLQAFDGSNGLLPYDPAQPNDTAYWQDEARWVSVRTVPSGTLNTLAEAPVYVVQKLPNSPNPASDPANPTFNLENYRITARAKGGDSSAVVILQAVVEYTP